MKSRALCCVAVTTLLAAWSWTICAYASPDAWRLPQVEPVAQPPAVSPPVDLLTQPPAFDPPVEPLADNPSTENGLSLEEIEAVEAEVLQDLEDQATWYDWVVPSHWHLPVNWESSFELGVDGSEGNSNTLSFRSGADVRRKADWSDLKISIDYVKSTAENVETKHNAQLEANHDWLLGESPWTLFAKTILVYDEFRPFDFELTLNAGFGYLFVDNETWSFKGRLGSGATRQWDGPDESWRPEAMLGIDFDYRFSDRQKLHVKSEYFPEWGDFAVYRVRTDAGWEMLLDEATNMSLKLGVIDRYDSNAGGTKPNALDYSLLLLWKL